MFGTDKHHGYKIGEVVETPIRINAEMCRMGGRITKWTRIGGPDSIVDCELDLEFWVDETGKWTPTGGHGHHFGSTRYLSRPKNPNP